MIKKYNQYIKESLLDKIEGYSIDDIKQKVLNGEISIIKYFKIIEDNNLEKPSDEEIMKILLKHDVDDILKDCIVLKFNKGIYYALNNNADILILNHRMFKSLLKLIKDDKKLLYKIIDEYFKNRNISFYYDEYYLLSCMYGYIDGIKNALALGVEPDLNAYKAIDIIIKYNQLDSLIFLLNYVKGTDMYNNFISVAKENIRIPNEYNYDIKKYLSNIRYD